MCFRNKKNNMNLTICGITELSSTGKFEHIVSFLDPPLGLNDNKRISTHQQLLSAFTDNPVHTILCKDIRGSRNTSRTVSGGWLAPHLAREDPKGNNVHFLKFFFFL
jgi:hypothetical protein